MLSETITPTIGEECPTSDPVPRVSIGMPVYNGENFLAEALDSMLAQTFADFELIISDNASTDRTEAICRVYAARDTRIRYYRVENNKGATWNFNRTFELARGEYFKWAAHDDLCDPTFVARCVEVLDNDPSVVCCHSKTRHIDVHGSILWDLPDPTVGEVDVLPAVGGSPRILNASSTSAQRRFYDVLFSDGWSARSEGVFRSHALRRTGMLLPVFGYEKVLMAELALIGRFHDIPETLFLQRIHPQAMSAIATSAKRRQVFEPQGLHHSMFPRLRLLAGYLRAVCQAKCPLGERLCFLVWIGTYLLQVRKWTRVLGSTIRGTGTGGGYREALKKMDRHQILGSRQKQHPR